MRPDFSRLYAHLDIRPDCTLDEFKRAYRRRIAELHPDKGAQADTPESHALLPDLIVLYVTATRFHRRHGRLPGARPSLPPRAGLLVATPAPPLANSAPASPTTAEPAMLPTLPEPSSSLAIATGERTSRRGMLMASVLVVLVVLLALSWDWPEPVADESAPGTTRVDPEAAAIAANINHLEVGMDEATVLAIQGEPMHLGDGRWDYGPSWLRFEQGRLVDWHSSPLHQLKTDTAQPPTQTAIE